MPAKMKKSRPVTNLILLHSMFSAFKKTAEAEELLKKLEEKENAENGFQKIRCPHCRWQPDASSRWFCSDCDAPEFFYNSCGAMWNTFETRGKCPGCNHQWRWTSCLRCGGWARHEDWYATKKD